MTDVREPSCLRVSGVLLDIDGTLLDSNEAHAQSWVEALAEFDIARRVEDVRPLIGMGADQLLPKLAGIAAESPQGAGIVDRRSSIFLEKYLPRLEPFPCVRLLLKRMLKDSLTLVIATSAGKDEIEPLLRAARIDDLIDAHTTSDDAEASKPAPDIVEAAVLRAGKPKCELVMLGDTPYDVAAAHRAGVRIAALRCGGSTDPALAGSIAIYDDPCDLLSHYESSPLAAAPERTTSAALRLQ
jgi:phosphoglycolate phosphatase-like HAD superfamily hydrolase